MRKLKILSLLAMIFASFFVYIQHGYAATITESKYENNKISLSGTTTGNAQVQIVLFDMDNSPVYMTTAPVENGKFNIVLPKITTLKNGDYTVKVADYDGENTDSKIISVLIESDTENVISTTADTDAVSNNSIKTGDENLLYICYICAILAIVSGMILLILNIRKRSKTNSKIKKS